MHSLKLCLVVLHRLQHLNRLAFELCLSTCAFPAVMTCIRKFNVYKVMVGRHCYIIYIHIYVHGPGTSRMTTGRLGVD
jgi:hypothetical protein